MRNIIWFIALIILLLIQAGILVPLGTAPVSLILIVVAIATILSYFWQGLIITLLGGLLLDFVSGSPDGLISMSMVAVFLLMHLLFNELLSREPNQYILAASVAVSTVVYYLVYVAVTNFFEVLGLTGTPDTRYLLTVQLPLALMWNLIFAYPIFRYYVLVQNLASRLPESEESIRV